MNVFAGIDLGADSRSGFLRRWLGRMNVTAMLTIAFLVAVASSIAATPQRETDSVSIAMVPQLGHSGPIRSLAYSPDGARIASGGDDGTIRLWNAEGSDVLAILAGGSARVDHLVYRPDGQQIASVGADRFVRLSDTAGAALATTVATDAYSVAYSPDGRHIASGQGDGTVRVWDVTTHEQVEVFQAHEATAAVTAVAYSPDGRRIVSGSRAGPVKVWEVATSTNVATLRGHENTVWSLAYSPDGRHIAAAGSDGTVRVWDAAGADPGLKLTGHEDAVFAVAYRHDGRRIVSASRDGTIRVWDAASGDEIAVFASGDAAAYSPDGRHVATGNLIGGIRVIKAGSGRTATPYVRRALPSISALAFNDRGDRIATATEGGAVWLWDAKSGAKLGSLSGSSFPVERLTFSPAGDRIAATFGSWSRVRVWDIMNDEIVDHDTRITSVAYSPNGAHVAAGNESRTLSIWEIATGEVVVVLDGHTAAVSSVAYSPDGTYIATGSFDHTIRIWNAASGTEVAVLKGHADRVRAVAYSPDGKRIASGSDDHTVRLWDTASGTEVVILEGHDDRVLTVAYNPDGQRIASGGDDGTVRLWDVGRADEHAVLYFPPGESALAVAYSPDGETLVVVNSAGSVRLWEYDRRSVASIAYPNAQSAAYGLDGQIAIGNVTGHIGMWNSTTEDVTIDMVHDSEVNALAFSPDGSRVVSSHEDWSVHVWDVKSGSRVRTFTTVEDWIRSFSSRDHRSVDEPSSCNRRLRVGGIVERAPHAVACSPTHVAHGRGAGTVLLPADGAVTPEVVLQILASDEWIAYRSDTFGYLGSAAAEDFVKVRFDGDRCPIHRLLGANTCPLYPLAWYENELRKIESLSIASMESQRPDVAPQEIRLLLVTVLQVLTSALVPIALVAAAGQVLVIFLYLRRRGNPMAIARTFFSHTDWRVVRPSTRGTLRLESQNGSARHAYAVAGINHRGTVSMEAIGKLVRDSKKRTRLYVVYPTSESRTQHNAQVRQLRDDLRSEVVPLDMVVLKDALQKNTCLSTLVEQDDLYVTRQDPYFENAPIRDRSFFFGRQNEIRSISRLLAQGQHVGVFGLRKSGKTSLANRLLERFHDTPIVMISCARADRISGPQFLSLMAQELHEKLHELRVRTVPGRVSSTDLQVATEVRRWKRHGRPEPCVIILDEVELLLPVDKNADYDRVREGRHVLGQLRSVAQNLQALAIVVIGYRPDINRINRLPSEVGENPMFMSFKEVYTGALAESENHRMLRELGAWRGITWEDDALARVYAYCGGQPFVTRLFASEACRSHKKIDLARVEEVASEIRDSMRRHQIGAWYRAMHDSLTNPERELLCSIGGASGQLMDDLPSDHADALTSIENFGLVRGASTIEFSAELFKYWVATRLL